MSAKNRHFELLKFLLTEKGDDIDQHTKNAALKSLVTNYHTTKENLDDECYDAIIFVIQQGADVNATFNLSRTDQAHLLHFAMSKHEETSLKLVQLLLKLGADTNQHISNQIWTSDASKKLVAEANKIKSKTADLQKATNETDKAFLLRLKEAVEHIKSIYPGDEFARDFALCEIFRKAHPELSRFGIEDLSTAVAATMFQDMSLEVVGDNPHGSLIHISLGLVSTIVES